MYQMAASIKNVVSLLDIGAASGLSGDAGLETVVRKGIPATSLRRLADQIDGSVQEIQEIAGINRSTFARRLRNDSRLKVDESDRVARVARVVGAAIDVLGRNEALQWLRQPNIALGQRIPLSMLGTDAGARQVERIIGRIEHTVYS
jgi:putative toxin-antitoxin system antitoxin component (TIGR02293 family)